MLEVSVRGWDDNGRRRPALVMAAAEPAISISSATLGGGLGAARWVVNAQVSLDYERDDPPAHVLGLARGFGLEGEGIGLLTAADVAEYQHVHHDGVQVVATVGITHPTWAAAPDEETRPWGAGTINVVVALPQRCSDGALVNLVATVAEAKAQALSEAGVAGTGTAVDAVAILCPASGEVAEYGGPRSMWGSRVARAVHLAVLDGQR